MPRDFPSDESLPFRLESTWTPVAPMASPRSGAAAVGHNGLGVVVGGFGASGAPLDSMERYDPQADTWTAVPETLATARGLHGAARIGDRMYVFGGVIGGGAKTGSLEVYNLAAQTWVTGPFASMNISRAAFGHAVFEGRIHVVGGEDGTGTALSSIEIYDPRSDAWTPAPPLPLALKGPLCLVESDRLTLFGGERSDGSLSDGVLVWVPGVDAWVYEDIRLPYSARDLSGGAAVHAWTHKGTPHADTFCFVFGGSDASGSRDGFFRFYSR